MMRTAVLMFSLFGTACTVGQVGKSQAVGSVDAGGLVDAVATGNGCVDRLAPPELMAHVHVLNNATNAGMDCLTCHVATSATGAPAFQFAGTVYKPDKTTPSVGVTIRVTGASGVVATGVTDDAGNFNITAGTLMNAFPATADLTACPNVTKMISTMPASGPGSGSCNTCHVAGGTAGGVMTIADQ